MLRNLTKRFIMNESIKVEPLASIQALYDIVTNVRVSNKRDENRMQVAKEHLRSIRRNFRSLNEKVNSLEEELNILKEEK